MIEGDTATDSSGGPVGTEYAEDRSGVGRRCAVLDPELDHRVREYDQ